MRFLSIVILLFSSVITVYAGTTGKIAGRILDASDEEPLIGVNIYLEGYPYGAATDEDGFYFILNIPPGTYSVVVQMLSYRDVKVSNVQVNVDLTTRLDFELKPEALELGEQITVVAERPLIQKDVTSSSVNVSSEEIEALPVETFDEVINLQAGIVAGHFRGGRSGEVSYLVDGIPINDPFNKGIGLEVENSSIQQLEVISGTFNAEYGQAMSGVVNIITKEGSQELKTDLSAYVGTYFTNHDDLFPNLDNLDKGGSRNLQGTLSGTVPILNKLTFFATGRYFKDDGHIYGRRVYNTTDSNPFLPNGDRSWVSMDDAERKSFHGKLTYQLTPSLKLSYAILGEDNVNHYYDHAYRLTPDGIQTQYQTSLHHNFIITHTLSNSAFYTLKLSRNHSNYKGYVFKDSMDARYVIPEQGLPQSDYTFRSGGNNNQRYDRNTTTYLIKLDFTEQFTKAHKVGIGLEFKQHQVENFWTAFRSAIDKFGRDSIAYPQKFTPGRDDYERKPIEFATYIQDKVEYEDLIINIGLRFDYFDPKTMMVTDPRNPEFNPLFPSGNEKTPVKTQLSPRIGIAFPISAKGVLHVSYGHFFQIPNFEYLYQNIVDAPDGNTKFFIDKSGLNTITGNPDLNPERTVSYEFGLQQVLYGDLVMDFTAYYRDIRNLIDTEVIETVDKNQYGRFINRDYGNVRGVILSLEKRFSYFWGAAIDYTYQIAEGNASDPRTVFQDNQADPPRESEKQLRPLDWDQRNTLNITLNTGKPGNWNIGLIGRLGSGTPYTADATFTFYNVSFLNNRTKPTFYSFDLKADKFFKAGKTHFRLFLLVYNIFDRKNETSVYGSTGRANKDLNIKFAGDVIGLNTIEDYVNNPGFYSAPRQIRVGISADF
jgi:outer membrane receptor protein involved in Fe transport